jgi:Uma2 family endonuclease
MTMTPSAQPVTYGLDPSIFRFSVSRYQRMIEHGILTSEDKIELLENYMVLRGPRSPRHDSTIQRLYRPLMDLLPDAWMLRILQTVVFSDSQPEPDFSVVRGNPRSYLLRHPPASDVGLIIEVADSSLLRDQRDKTRIYARGGVPCYWIINLVDQRVEVYTQPSGPTAVPAYQTFQIYQHGYNIPLVLDGNPIGAMAVVDLLP